MSVTYRNFIRYAKYDLEDLRDVLDLHIKCEKTAVVPYQSANYDRKQNNNTEANNNRQNRGRIPENEDDNDAAGAINPDGNEENDPVEELFVDNYHLSEYSKNIMVVYRFINSSDDNRALVEGRKLKTALRRFNFEVQRKTILNCTEEQMEGELQNLYDSDLSDVGCVAMMLLDPPPGVEEKMLLKLSRAPTTMVGKPKIFLTEKGVSGSLDLLQRVLLAQPAFADMLVVDTFSSVIGHYGFEVSKFILELCNTINRLRGRVDLEAVIKATLQKIIDEVHVAIPPEYLPKITSTLTKQLLIETTQAGR